MNVFAISDLHLPGGHVKPMDIFGAHWTDHFARISTDWRARVSPSDLVLIPGDISWAMHLSEALADLLDLGALPGRKVLLRGNHDYWWQSITRVREALPDGLYALQNDALVFGRVVLCGARGWLCPGATPLSREDAKIYARELTRLELSLRDAQRKAAGIGDPWRVAMLHFPPFAERGKPAEATELLSDYGVHDAIYGHLHGPGLSAAFSGKWNGVRYHQVSCDGLGFQLKELRGPETRA